MNSHSTHRWFSRQVVLQLVAIVGMSFVLGFAFNSANPIGVRFDQPAAELATAAVNPDKTPISEIPVRVNPEIAPPLPIVPVKVEVVAPQPVFNSGVVTPHTITNHPVHIPAPQAVAANPAPIHWPEARTLVGEGRGVLVDVRHKGVFDAGHIPGAISLPENSSPEIFTAFLNQQPTNRTLIVYCSSTSCSQSARVANRFVQEFRRSAVRYMTGGYLEYQQMELAKPTPAPVP